MVFKVGLTGGIGSGKSTVANLFKLKQIEVIDADQIAREIVLPGTDVLKQITLRFGKGILLSDGQLNRKKLGEIVFSDKNQLNWLNGLIHPKVRSSLLEKAESSKSRYVIFEIPLLVENNLTQLVDRVLVVDVSPEVQIERVRNRDGLSNEQINNIINNQASRELKLQAADEVIENNGDIELLHNQVNMLHLKYLELAS